MCSQRGSAAVEFALVLPLVLVVALALVQTGLLIRDRLLVEAAARAGARAAAVQDDAVAIRAAAVAHRVTCITTLSAAEAAAQACRALRQQRLTVTSLQERFGA